MNDEFIMEYARLKTQNQMLLKALKDLHTRGQAYYDSIPKNEYGISVTSESRDQSFEEALMRADSLLDKERWRKEQDDKGT